MKMWWLFWRFGGYYEDVVVFGKCDVICWRCVCLFRDVVAPLEMLWLIWRCCGYLETWWLIWRSGGSFWEVVAHFDKWWLNLRSGGSFGDVRAYLNMLWIIRRRCDWCCGAVAYWKMWWLTGRRDGLFSNAITFCWQCRYILSKIIISRESLKLRKERNKHSSHLLVILNVVFSENKYDIPVLYAYFCKILNKKSWAKLLN